MRRYLTSALIFNVFFLHSPPQLTPSPTALPYLANFVLFAVLGVWFGLLRARGELERRVVERTAELERVNRELRAEVEERSRAEEQLRRSEWYLAEAQKLSHIGSWGRSRGSGCCAQDTRRGGRPPEEG